MVGMNTRAEDAVIELLAYRGPCTMDEVFASLPTHDGRDLLSAVGMLSRDGRLLLRGDSGSGYHLFLSSSPPVERRVRKRPAQVPFCMGCGYLCDEIDPEDAQAPWIDAHRYLKKYGGTWIELDRNEGFCPTCARLFACARQGTSFAHP